MNNLTAELNLKKLILEKYRSVRAFSAACGLPYTTVDNVFRRGIGSLGLDTAERICAVLGLDLSRFAKGELRISENGRESLRKEEDELLAGYHRLDGYGKKLVRTVLACELKRTAEQSKTVYIAPDKDKNISEYKSFEELPIACRGGVTFTEKEDSEQIKRLYERLVEK